MAMYNARIIYQNKLISFTKQKEDYIVITSNDKPLVRLFLMKIIKYEDGFNDINEEIVNMFESK